MHVVLLVLTLFYFDGGKHPFTATLEAPSLAACNAAAPKLKQQVLATRQDVRDVQWTCIDHHQQDNP